MAPQPEQQARANIDRLLEAAGWHVCDGNAADIHVTLGIAIHAYQLSADGWAPFQGKE